ncbi:hypothetical protein HZS61_004699 [Fusarium oxysporum f. sp. conglutinans]|uniref:Uncharacterized protein n=1 Tax=Fusarium oxysporum f. sp. conglutinans TaxID=100902 RepID=A0A8H6LE93_FUSOX|nr:hypothetical protein HZS61_004699 [Fusarium oxysporum f. sp. conglutinans]
MNSPLILMMTIPVIDKLDLHPNLGIRVANYLSKDILTLDNWTPWVRCNTSVVTSKNEVVYDSRVECPDFEFRAITFRGVVSIEQSWNANDVLISKSKFPPQNLDVAVDSLSALIVQLHKPHTAQ